MWHGGPLATAGLRSAIKIKRARVSAWAVLVQPHGHVSGAAALSESVSEEVDAQTQAHLQVVQAPEGKAIPHREREASQQGMHAHNTALSVAIAMVVDAALLDCWLGLL
jgi:hypothetical protein